jgi:hypothetical protein
MVMQAPPEMDLERKELLRDGRRPQGKAKARLSERSTDKMTIMIPLPLFTEMLKRGVLGNLASYIENS